jgi:tetratricopeptide (TPR) repeat protein
MRFVKVVLLASLTALPLSASVEEGDRLFARRAEGHQGARAQAAPIDAAIAAYQRAAVSNPTDLEAHWKLLRALRFKGAYVAANNEQKKQIYGAAKKAGAAGLAAVGRQVAAKGVTSLDKASEKQVAAAIRSIPHAGEVFYWDAVVWGEWALAYGKMAAVREGAGDRIRRETTIVYLSDPKIERGGGARILGRLHNQTPRVPFITGWASDDEAVKFLKLALAHDPQDKLTRVFLAEAMAASNRSTKKQAVELLQNVVRGTPDPNWIVEEIAAQNDAKALLKSWGEECC